MGHATAIVLCPTFTGRLRTVAERISDLFDRCDIGPDMCQEQGAQIAAQARDLAYTSIGLGILGFQRAQVLRRQYQPAVEQFVSELRAHCR